MPQCSLVLTFVRSWEERAFQEHFDNLLQNYIYSIVAQYFILLDKYFLILKGTFKFLSLDFSFFICAFTCPLKGFICLMLLLFTEKISFGRTQVHQEKCFTCMSKLGIS